MTLKEANYYKQPNCHESSKLSLLVRTYCPMRPERRRISNDDFSYMTDPRNNIDFLIAESKYCQPEGGYRMPLNNKSLTDALKLLNGIALPSFFFLCTTGLVYKFQLKAPAFFVHRSTSGSTSSTTADLFNWCDQDRGYFSMRQQGFLRREVGKSSRWDLGGLEWWICWSSGWIPIDSETCPWGCTWYQIGSFVHKIVQPGSEELVRNISMPNQLSRLLESISNALALVNVVWWLSLNEFWRLYGRTIFLIMREKQKIKTNVSSIHPVAS